VDIIFAGQLQIVFGVKDFLCFPNRVLLSSGIVLDIVTPFDDIYFLIADDDKFAGVFVEIGMMLATEDFYLFHNCLEGYYWCHVRSNDVNV
jgi:hypothetical protein